MEGRGRELFDTSNYMLFEASGDSEAEPLDFEGESNAAVAAVKDKDNDNDNDNDAQSCSMVWASDVEGGELQQDVIEATDEEEDWYKGKCSGYISEEEEEEEEGVVDQCPIKVRRADKSRGRACEDSNAKLLNQKERDRLFWEECLAS